MGAGGKLVSGGPFLQLMMNEPLPSASTENQRTALKEEVERCKMLMLNNMDKFGGSKGR